MSYFVKEAEIAQKQKDINTALALALFLGAIGVHRFYLGRRLSGTIILCSVIITLGQALWVVIPVVVVEFFQLAFIADRMKETPDRSIITHHKPVKEIKYTNQPESVHRPETKVTVFDVSEVDTSKVTRDVVASKVSRSSVDQEWIEKLELPYERQDLQLPQLRKSIYGMYESLAEYIDQLLRERGSSLHKLSRQRPQGQYAYYSNILYTIFCVAEGHVTDHYTGSEYRSYNNDFSYDLLRDRIDETFRIKVEKYANELAARLPPADDDIKKHFGLTPNGLRMTWWDQDGELREKYPLTEKHTRILGLTPPRNTKLYEVTDVRAIIFRHYFSVLATLHKQLTEADKWPKRVERYLHEVFDEDKQYVNNHYNIMILNNILKLCEQAVREKLPYTRSLDISKERVLVTKTIPAKAARVVLEAVDKPKEFHVSEKILGQLRLQNPASWREDVNNIESKNIFEVISLLRMYESLDSLPKVAKEIIGKHADNRAQLLALYEVYKEARSDEWFDKKMSRLVHEDQITVFKKMTATRIPVSESLIGELTPLQLAPRRQVVLDRSKLAVAELDHTRAVNSITAYLGDEEDKLMPESTPVPAKPSDVDKAQLTDDQIEFIKLALEDKLDLAAATAFAKSQKKMLNGYIQSINRLIYDKFDDQVILQLDGRIVVEDEYKPALKELI